MSQEEEFDLEEIEAQLQELEELGEEDAGPDGAAEDAAPLPQGGGQAGVVETDECNKGQIAGGNSSVHEPMKATASMEDKETAPTTIEQVVSNGASDSPAAGDPAHPSAAAEAPAAKKPAIGRKKKILAREAPAGHPKKPPASSANAPKAADPDLLRAIMESDQLQPSSKQPAQARAAVRKAPKKAKNATKATPAKEAKARQKSAYYFFAADKRVAFKEQEPNLSISDMSTRLSKLWKALSAEEKKPYEDQAAASTLQILGDASEAPAGKTIRARSAYQLFCNANRASVKAAHGDASFGTITQLLAKAWKGASAEEKKPYEEQAEAEKVEKPAKPANRKRGRPPKAAARSSKGEPEADDDHPAVEERSKEPDSRTSRTLRAESGDESDREECDWEEHPAEAILGTTLNQKLIVKRKGLDLTEYGLVDASLVKRQRLEGNSKAPVSLQMLEEYEKWQNSFQKAVLEHTDRGALDLEDLGRESPLESCYFLGKLVEKNYPFSRAERGKDVMGKYPVLGLSMISQRLLDLEKGKRVAAEEEAAALKQKLQEALAGKATVLQAEE